MAVSRPQAVGRHVGVADDLSGAFGYEIGKVPADNIEAPLPHVILARRLGLEGREPMENVMRVDFGDCGNVTRLAGANADAGCQTASNRDPGSAWKRDPSAALG